MSENRELNVDEFMAGLKRRNPGEPEYHQAVYEVASNVFDYIQDKQVYLDAQIVRRIAEPDRIVIFRVCWEDDNNNVRVNRGYRVQNSNAIGPYKGGLRFHPSVNLSILKFLAFEQTFKNSLTGLPMGGGKGGSDFNPKGKSDAEVMRFCQAFMTELYRHIGDDIDVPAGDIGVGAREIGFLFGQYKRLTNRFTGVLTGKSKEFGGSPMRREATGYGAVYMMEHMLGRKDEGVEGKTCLISGAGNVALHATEKLIELGAKVVTLSDSGGFIHDKHGINADKLEFIKKLKIKRRGSLQEYAREYDVEYHAGERPWKVPGQLVFPCATQNELSSDDAATLIDNGCEAVSEGANMPVEQNGIRKFVQSGVLFAPSKAANAGGVALSGLEMSQNSMRTTWDQEQLDQRLRTIMREIHERCVEYGKTPGQDEVDYVRGANIGGFIKVADAMVAFGVM